MPVEKVRVSLVPKFWAVLFLSVTVGWLEPIVVAPENWIWVLSPL